MYPEVTSIQQAKELLINQFKEDLSKDLDIDSLEFGRIEDYKTNHPNGALVIFYDGGKFTDSMSKNVVHTQRDLRIVAFLKTRVDKGVTFRDNMIDAVIESAAGLKFKTVSKADRVRPVSDEYLTPDPDGDKNFFDHPVVFVVPAQFVQKKHLTED